MSVALLKVRALQLCLNQCNQELRERRKEVALEKNYFCFSFRFFFFVTSLARSLFPLSLSSPPRVQPPPTPYKTLPKPASRALGGCLVPCTKPPREGRSIASGPTSRAAVAATFFRCRRRLRRRRRPLRRFQPPRRHQLEARNSRSGPRSPPSLSPRSRPPSS